MKRIFLLATIMLALLGCQIRANEVPAPSSDDLSSVVRRFKGVDGFNIINIGSFGTALAKSVIGIAAADEDPEVRVFLKNIKDIRSMTIVEYEDASSSEISAFNAAVSPILDEDNLILEARDDEDLVKIYGIPDEKNPGIIKNIVIYVPSDEVLLKINGSVDVAAIAQYAQ